MLYYYGIYEHDIYGNRDGLLFVTNSIYKAQSYVEKLNKMNIDARNYCYIIRSLIDDPREDELDYFIKRQGTFSMEET